MLKSILRGFLCFLRTRQSIHKPARTEQFYISTVLSLLRRLRDGCNGTKNCWLSAPADQHLLVQSRMMAADLAVFVPR